VAADFFTVPTVRTLILFVFIVPQHKRRKGLHFAVTEHPRAEWAGQKIVETSANRDAPRYLVRDRDASYGNDFRCRVRSLGMRELITTARSPTLARLCQRYCRRQAGTSALPRHGRRRNTLHEGDRIWDWLPPTMAATPMW
jgi:hypothetical protein